MKENNDFKKQKILKAITTLFIVVLCFFIFDFICYTSDWNNQKKENEKRCSSPPDFDYTWSLYQNPYKHLTDIELYRKPSNIKSPLEPIYIFGCSFAYGDKLNDNETFGAKLAEQTGYPVYNFSSIGFGIQHMLYIMNEQLISLSQGMGNTELKYPRYIIFVYINNHISNMYYDFLNPSNNLRYLKYENKKGKLVLKQNSCFIFKFYTVRKLQYFFANILSKSKLLQKRNFNLIEQYFITINESIKQKFPDTEFIILVYNPTNYDLLYDWTRLNKYGIKTILTTDLTKEPLGSEEYIFPNSHPNKKVWELLTPLFIEKADIH